MEELVQLDRMGAIEVKRAKEMNKALLAKLVTSWEKMTTFFKIKDSINDHIIGRLTSSCH